MANNLSRRRFVEAASIAGVALVSLSSCAPNTPGSSSERTNTNTGDFEWTSESEAIVVGAGGGGLMAALELAEQGISTVLLECNSDVFFSSSALCGGYISMCETEMQPNAASGMIEDMLKASRENCKRELIEAYAEVAPSLCEKLKGLGVEYLYTEAVGGMSSEWAHCATDGKHVIEKLFAAVEENDLIEFVPNSRVKKLVVNGKKVVGVELEDGTTRYGASHGVVLATGDFTRNPILIAAYGPKGSDSMVAISGTSCFGDGFVAATEIGAAPSYVTAGVNPTVSVGVNTDTITLQYMNSGAIIVGIDGKRFTNESQDYVQVTKSALSIMGSNPHFIVYDSAMREILAEHPHLPFSIPNEPELTGETLEDLAAAIKAEYSDFDNNAFVAEIARYNTFVAAGNDENFGRNTISGSEGTPLPVEQSPFYCICCKCASDHFTGGIAIDTKARVLDFNENPIPGLYATGGVSGGLHGWGYMTGTCFGGALVYGIIAAQSIASE